MKTQREEGNQLPGPDRKEAIPGALPGLAWLSTIRQLSGPWLESVSGAHLSLDLLVLGLLPGPFQLSVSSRELLAQQTLLCVLQRQGLDMRRESTCEGAGELGIPLRHNRMLPKVPCLDYQLLFPCPATGQMMA